MTVVDELQQLADAIEQLPHGEVLGTVLPCGVDARERTETLNSVQKVADELRRRGHKPRVEIRRTPDGEFHALSIERRAA